MYDVSCRALGEVLAAARARGIPDSIITNDVGYDIAYLRNTKHRIGWAAFCQVLRNLRSVWSLDEMSELGESFMVSPFFSYVGAIARFLFTSRDLFDWICKRQVGGGAQLFADCVKPSYEHVGLNTTIIRLEVQGPCEPSPEFFWMTRGAFIAMPELVGSGRAQVELAIVDKTATYRVTYRNRRDTAASLIRFAAWPFNARTVANELKAAHESLQERYQQLDTTRAALERKQVVLDAAHRLGRSVWGQRDPEVLARELTNGLLGIVGIVGARVDIEGLTSTRTGRMDEGEGRVSIELGGRQMSGRIDAWTETCPEEAKALLDLLAPNVALAVDNALAYRELEEYQRGLERLVDQRTAELRQARDDLSETVKQLRDAQLARERIFHGISHEIRTPLSLILLAVADIEARSAKVLEVESRDALGSVVASARKLLRLVDELLLLAAGEQDRLKLERRPTDVARLIGAILQAWRPAAEQHELAIDASVPESLVMSVDPIGIERVVTNLISNAVKFTPPGGRITVEVARLGGNVEMVVRDTGVGISDELMPRLFGRFERGHDTRRGGSGIGLALVKELAEAHGGHATARRVEPRGTEFRVILPFVDAGEVGAADAPRLKPGDFGHADEAPPVVSGQVFTPPGRSAATIVVAEDNPRLAYQIARLLSDEHTVIVGLDGVAAAELVKEHQPQLLVTDVNMPGMNGIELTRRFREITGDKVAPVVILSAVADLGTRVAGLEAGAVDYVNKPFDPVELRARVRAQLSMRDLAVRLHRAEQLSALGTLSSGLAHELRNPANGIVNAIGPLKALLPAELRDPDGAVGQLIDVLGGCAEQIGFLSRQLLAFRRGGALELRLVPLGDVVQRSLTFAHTALRGVEVREKIASERPVRCAPPLMVQVVSNLVENAAHAAGPGGWVEIASHETGGRLVIEVSDSGPGVPPDLRERIFEPFFTTKPPGVGTGLGLPMARDIIHRHGGVLEVRERDGRSVFVVDLPSPPAAELVREAMRDQIREVRR